MRPLKRAAAILYLLCCVLVLGSFACSIVGPAQERMAYLLGHVFQFLCLVVV